LISFSLKKNSQNLDQTNLQNKLNLLLSNLINDVFLKCQNKIDHKIEEFASLFEKNFFSNLDLKLPNILNNIIFNYLNLRIQIEILESNLITLQALYDNIEEFLDLRKSCDCEKNYPKHKNFFSYQEINFIVQKQLKLISQRIVITRLNLASKKFTFFRYYFKIMRTIKFNNFAPKNKKIIKSFLKQIKKKNYLNLRLTYNYKFLRLISNFILSNLKENEVFIEKILSNNIVLLKVEIIELIHNYHKLLIAKKFQTTLIKTEKKKPKKEEIEPKARFIIDNLTSSVYQKSLKIIKLLNCKKNILF